MTDHQGERGGIMLVPTGTHSLVRTEDVKVLAYTPETADAMKAIARSEHEVPAKEETRREWGRLFVILAICAGGLFLPGATPDLKVKVFIAAIGVLGVTQAIKEWRKRP